VLQTFVGVAAPSPLGKCDHNLVTNQKHREAVLPIRDA